MKDKERDARLKGSTAALSGRDKKDNDFSIVLTNSQWRAWRDGWERGNRINGLKGTLKKILGMD